MEQALKYHCCKIPKTFISFKNPLKCISASPKPQLKKQTLAQSLA